MIKELKTGTSQAIANNNSVVYIPDGLARGEKRPVVIFLYGISEVRSATTDFQALYKYGPAKFLKGGWKPPFIVVCVQQSVKWIGSKEEEKIVSDVLSKTPASDLILTGLSDGAITWNGYLSNPDHAAAVKAAFLFSGDVTSSFVKNIAGLKNVYYRAWHGDRDTTVKITSIAAAVPKMQAAGIDAKLTIYSGGHGGWDDFYNPQSKNQIWDWITQLSTPKVVVEVNPVVISPVVPPVIITPIITPFAPLKIEAEDYKKSLGIECKKTADNAGGGMYVGFLKPSSFADYIVEVPEEGNYDIVLRVSAQSGDAVFQMKNAIGEVIGQAVAIQTRTWSIYQEMNASIKLIAGKQTIRLQPLSKRFNLNWFVISK